MSSFGTKRWAGKVARIFRILVAFSLLGGPFLGFSAGMAYAVAATHSYQVYFDTDANTATGCGAALVDASGPSNGGGYEYQLTVTVDDGGAASPLALSACGAGAFGPGVPVGQISPAAVQSAGGTTTAQMDFSIPLAAMQQPASARMAVASAGDYVLLANGAPVPLAGGALPPVPGPGAPLAAIPALSLPWLVVLGLAMAAAAWRWRHLALRAKGQALAVLLCVAVLGTGLAAVRTAIDWQAMQPAATDALGDNMPGTPDLHRVFLYVDGGELSMRLDAVTGVSNLRALAPQERQSTAPRFLTFPALHAQAGQPWTYAVQASAGDGQALPVQLRQAPAGMALHGAAPAQTLQWTPPSQGAYQVSLEIQDGAQRSQAQTFTIDVADDRALPPDPATQATPLAQAGFTPFHESTAFLYTGANPVQTGMQAQAMDSALAAVVRGRVLDRAGQPLPGVTVRILGHEEWGGTRTRADGWFDMAVNGGAMLTFEYGKSGYLAAQRTLQVPVGDWAIADDVVLIPYDGQYSQIDLAQGVAQTYWGSETTDQRGTRRSALFFPAGTQAQMRLPDGTARPLQQMTVRVTEYTVGESGPQAMPGGLPRSVGYTWAANYTADEAQAAGARSVEFSQPVIAYVTNFIGAPVGTAVPAGWYDFERAAWVGEDNGRVIRIRSVDGSMASVQVTEADRAATPAELQALGITGEELTHLAAMYPAGTELWRTPMVHFTPWDMNWPYGPPPDAIPPPWEDSKPNACGPNMCCNPGEGSDIYFEQRAMGQGIDLPGTPFALYYRSDRTGAKVKLSVPTRAAALPPSLHRVEFVQQIAGRRITASQTPSQAMAQTRMALDWDGRDVYGREMRQGAQASVTVSYVYPAVYYPVASDFARSFERVAGAAQMGMGFSRPGGAEMAVTSTSQHWMDHPAGPPDVAAANAGQWALQGTRLYDPSARKIYEGGGQHYSAQELAPAFNRVMTWESNAAQPLALAIAAQQYAFVADSARISQNVLYPSAGTLNQFWVTAGNGTPGFSGDGGPASEAQIDRPTALAMNAWRSILLVADSGNQRLRSISMAGGKTIQTLAGNGSPYDPQATGVPALQTGFAADHLLATSDGNVYSSYQGRLRQLTASGYTYNIPTPGEVTDLAEYNNRIWVATTTGIHVLNANGTFTQIVSDAGATRLQAKYNGLYYLVDGVLKFLGNAGQAVTVNTGLSEVLGAGAYRLMGIDYNGAITVALERSPGVVDIGRYNAGLPPYGSGTYALGQRSGLAVDEFDAYGRQTATRTVFGGAQLMAYRYNADGYLIAAEDPFGKQAWLERDANNRLTAVVGFNGQRTTLAYDANGLLSQVVQPGGITHAMRYDGAPGRQGLLLEYTDPRGGSDRFAYDVQGRLVDNTGPDGGGWHLASDAQGRLLVSSAEGRTTLHETAASVGGQLDKTLRLPDGTTRTEQYANGAFSHFTEADGLVSTLRFTNHPQLGAASPGVLREQEYGAGRTLNTGSQIKLARGASYTSIYDPLGWERHDTVNQYTWVTRYDGDGQFTSTTPMGRTARAAYTPETLPNWEESPTGEQTSYTYTAQGDLEQVTRSADGSDRTTRYTYHPAGMPGAGQVATITDPLGRSAAYAYDSAGRLTRQTQPDGKEIDYGYDAHGNLVSLGTPSGVSHLFDYTPKDRMAGYQAPALAAAGGTATRWLYNKDRELVEVQRPGGASLHLSRSATTGQLLSVQDSAGPSLQYSYRADGKVGSISTSDGYGVAYSYSGPLWTGTIHTGYPQAASVEREYSSANFYGFFPRPQAYVLKVGASTQALPLAYDADGNATRFGALTFARDQATAGIAVLETGGLYTTYRTNGYGEPMGSQALYKTPLYAGTREHYIAAVQAAAEILRATLTAEIARQGTCTYWEPDWSYPDYPGRRLELKSGQALPTDFPKEPPYWKTVNPCLQRVDAYIGGIIRWVQMDDRPDNALELLNGIEPAFAQGAAAFLPETDYAGDPVEPRSTQSFITPQTQHQIDALRQELLDAQANATKWNVAYEYNLERDAAGRIERITSVSVGQTQPPRQYTYDQAGRLHSATSGEGPAATTTWDYDANGNRTHENGTVIAEYDAQDRLQRWRDNSYTYTPAGELQTKANAGGTTRYSYDGRGQLRQVQLANGPTIDYAIDPLGRRTAKRLNGQVQWHLLWLDALRPLAQLKPDGSLDATFHYGDKPNVPEALERGGKLYRILTDHLGSVRVVVDTQTGQIVQEMAYDAWGRVTQDTNPGFQPFGYAGGLYDADTGLTRFGARDYDGEAGRWTAKDPILFGGGSVGLYGYVGGDPLSFVDPTGLLHGIPIEDVSILRPQPQPPVNDPCVQKYLLANYGDALNKAINFGNLQQYLPVANPDAYGAWKEGMTIGAEKAFIAKGPGIAGNALMRANPGNLSLGYSVGSKLAGFSGVVSGAAEVGGAFLVPFGTAAMIQAREACSCGK